MTVCVEKQVDYQFNGHRFEPFWLILNERRKPPLLPLMFTTFLARFSAVFEIRELSDGTLHGRTSKLYELVERDVSDATIRAYVYALAQFLGYLEECRLTHQTAGLHASSSCSERFVNHYLNEVLSNRLKSAQSLQTHLSALTAYYNFLHYMEFSPRLALRVYRRTRQAMAERNTKQHYIQYVPRHARLTLLNHCETLAEKLMMRMGFEVGLRTAELRGLRTPALCILFKQLDNRAYDHVERFSYWLEGRYAKNSKSGWVYFDRDLLSDMRRYFSTERQWAIDESGSADESFFLRTDPRFLGTGISEWHASRRFRQRADEAGLHPSLSFHDLRHTFATELFHEELTGPDGRETRSESAALIVVAQRLRHTVGRDGHASSVTTRYIRMRLQMLELEGGR